MMAESNRFPPSTAKPAWFSIGLSYVLITSPSAFGAWRRLWAMVLPDTVITSPWIFRRPRSSFITVGTPPARWKASPRYLPAGMQFTSSGMS